jgi:hypothetical protein
MATFATKEEQAVIKAALAFANLRHIDGARQVEEIFSRLPQVPGYFQSIERLPDGTVLPLQAQVEAYERDQQKVRDWLRRIVKPGERRNVSKEISQALTEKVRTHYTLDATNRGPVLAPHYALDGVEATCAFGLALILDSERGITNRLQQCPAPGCGKFRLDLVTKGRPGRYCKPEHKVAFEIAEVKRKRQEEKILAAKKLLAAQPKRK